MLNSKRDREEEKEPKSKSDSTITAKKDPLKYMEKILEESERKMKKFKNEAKISSEKILIEKSDSVIQSSQRLVDSAKNPLDFDFRSEVNNLNEPTAKTSFVSTTYQSSTTSSTKTDSKFLMDDQGRIMDEKGNIVQIKPQNISTLKININKDKEKKVKELLKIQKIDQTNAKITEPTKFYDPNLDIVKKRRDQIKKRSFNFAEQGSFLKNLDELRKRQNAKELGIDLNSTQLTKEDERGLINLDLMQIKPNFLKHPIKLKALDLIPDIEWWDAYFLPNDKKSFSPFWSKDLEGNWIQNTPEETKFEDYFVNEKDLLKEKITSYVQHPVPLKNEILEKKNNVSLPIFLTQKEKKRFKRLKRLENEKEKQEKLKLGLIKPDPPKLKFNNFMRILGDQAIQDPSQVEKIVRKAYEERYSKMLKENEQRKLTKEQKKEKIKRKFERDSKKEVRACLFKIENLGTRKNRFRIDKNSQQLYLTGVCIMGKKKSNPHLPSLVYAEGGPLAIKKLKNLLLRRINWEDKKSEPEEVNEEEEDDSEDESKPKVDGDYKMTSKCVLVWEGNLKNRYFDKWKMTEVKTENDAKKILGEKGIEHYWNLVTSFKLEDIQ